MEPTIFKPRLKFKPPLKFFKFGHWSTYVPKFRLLDIIVPKTMINVFLIYFLKPDKIQVKMLNLTLSPLSLVNNRELEQGYVSI